MLTIEFQGQRYLFVGDSLDQSGPIATEAAFRSGRASFAHYYPGPSGSPGVIKQFGAVIGHQSDITVIGPVSLEPLSRDELIEALGNLCRDSSWEGDA